MVSVLLSSHTERVGVSRMRDFYFVIESASDICKASSLFLEKAAALQSECVVFISTMSGPKI